MALSSEMNYLMNSLSCVLHNGAQHTNIQIVEHDSSAKLRKVSLKTSPNGDWFCFCPDEGRKCKHIHGSAKKVIVMSPLLKIAPNLKHHCACDSVLFFKKNEKLIVVYMDLKSGNPTGYENQFKSTRQFVRYLVSLCEEFVNTTISIDEERYVIFYSGDVLPSLRKTTTTPKSNIKQSKPDRAYLRLVKNNDTLYLDELLI